ncbi:MAG: SpoIIE family protein phosphatase [Bacteroidia bacterium]|nr:SpoIIE family protein phosphatase [Bacteroidia bacterium]
MPSAKVSDVFLDDNSMLWIATYGGGLVKYDGINFEPVYDKKDYSTLFTRIIYKENDSSLLVGNSLGLYRYTNGNYTNVQLLDTQIIDPFGAKMTFQVSGIIKKATTYFVSTSRGVIELTATKKHIYGFKMPYAFNNDIIEFEKNIYVFSDNGINILNTKEKKILSVPTTFKNLKCRKAIIYNDTLLVASNQGLLFIKNKTVVKVISSQSLKGFPDDLTTITASSQTKSLWVGFSSGLMNYLPNRGFTIINEKNGLDNSPITSILEGNDGTLIAASSVSGLYISKGNVFNNYDNLEDLKTISTFNFNDSILYFLTPRHLYNININTNQIVEEKDILSGKDEKFKDFIISKKNKLYYYTTDNVLNIVDLKNKKNRRIIKSIDGTNLNVMYLDKDQKLYLALSSGAYYLNPSETQIIKEEIFDIKANVFEIYEAGAYKYFLTGRRLFREKNGVYTSLNIKTQYYFKNIVEDHKNNLWILAQEDLLLYDGRYFYSVKDKLDFSYTNIKLLQVSGNKLIITADNGVYVINLDEYYTTKELKYKKFNERDGAASCINISSRNAIDSKGNLWYGTNLGLVKFNIKSIHDSVTPPKIILKNIKLFHETVNWRELGVVVKNNLPQNLVLDYNKNNLTFSFVGINILNPSKVLYSVKLEGADNFFSKETAINEINYSGLQPGTYKLLIKAKIEGNDWGEETINFVFRIKPPFYRTLPFLLISAVFFIALIFLIFKLRLKRINDRNIYLERIVKKRTTELDQKNNLLNEVNIRLDQKNKLIINSLEYAQNLQRNILRLDTDFINDISLIGKCSIFYRPKDIVSGDFYASFNVEGNIYLVIADCTGHGVPGALMTIFSYSILKKVIVEEKVRKLSEILERVNELFLENLKAEKGQIFVNDGMAVSIMVFDTLRGEAQLASVQQSIFAVTDNEIREYRFNSTPINSFSEKYNYETVRFSPKKGDRLIFYTDGIIDQKGEINKRRLMKAGFKEWVLMGNLEGAERYSKPFTNWLGSLEQIDDVLVLELEF